jgi:alanine racemase
MAVSWVEIDLNAVTHNLKQAAGRLKPETRIMAVVKSDAYGHGMVPVARTLEQHDVAFFGVSKFWEALELRENGIRLPILVLVGFEPEDIDDALRLDIRPVLFRPDHAEALSKAAVRHQRPAKVHIKVDTGMGRLGVPVEQLPDFFDRVTGLPGLEIEGMCSHFAVADEADKSYSIWQLKRFQQALQMASEGGLRPRYAHISNSAGTLDLPQAHFQLVRPGLMLYGSQPSAELMAPADLRPAMTFKSKVLQVKEVPPGRAIGYGRTYVTTAITRIATIAVGYDDGYPRLLSNKAEVLIGGRRAPIVGRVSMNLITADVTHLPELSHDAEVALLGAQGSERITAEELAALSQTISYEIYCLIGRHRFKRFLPAEPA